MNSTILFCSALSRKKGLGKINLSILYLVHLRPKKREANRIWWGVTLTISQGRGFFVLVWGVAGVWWSIGLVYSLFF